MTKQIITTHDKTYTYHNLEGSKWIVAIPHDGMNGSYFEWQGEYGEMSGELVFEGRMLVDFDGCYELPNNVCRVLHQLGYTFDQYMLPDRLVLE